MIRGCTLSIDAFMVLCRDGTVPEVIAVTIEPCGANSNYTEETKCIDGLLTVRTCRLYGFGISCVQGSSLPLHDEESRVHITISAIKNL